MYTVDGRPGMVRVAPPHELVQQDSHIVMGEGVLQHARQDPKESPDAEHLSFVPVWPIRFLPMLESLERVVLEMLKNLPRPE